MNKLNLMIACYLLFFICHMSFFFGNELYVATGIYAIAGRRIVRKISHAKHIVLDVQVGAFRAVISILDSLLHRVKA